jgi:excisionase family DNA binding protein
MNENIPIRLSVSEASKLFGVSTRTIKSAIDNNEILYIVVRGRYKIHFGSLLEWSQRSTRRKNLFNSQGIGQYTADWQIKNQKYSPDPKIIIEGVKPPKTTNTKKKFSISHENLNSGFGSDSSNPTYPKTQSNIG